MSTDEDYSDMRGQVVFMDKWYIQVPIHLILLEILVACILRIVYAVINIKKYRHKIEECYRPPILDESYYSGGPMQTAAPMPPTPQVPNTPQVTTQTAVQAMTKTSQIPQTSQTNTDIKK